LIKQKEKQTDKKDSEKVFHRFSLSNYQLQKNQKEVW